MRQGEKRKLAPKDKHSKASWKKRDDRRKGKQEAYGLVLASMETLPGFDDAITPIIASLSADIDQRAFNTAWATVTGVTE